MFGKEKNMNTMVDVLEKEKKLKPCTKCGGKRILRCTSDGKTYSYCTVCATASKIINK